MRVFAVAVVVTFVLCAGSVAAAEFVQEEESIQAEESVQEVQQEEQASAGLLSVVEQLVSAEEQERTEARDRLTGMGTFALPMLITALGNEQAGIPEAADALLREMTGATSATQSQEAWQEWWKNEQPRYKCEPCEGSGLVRCFSCTQGKAACFSCGGIGSLGNHRCSICSGSGRVVCPFCGGAGLVRCTACGGDGITNEIQKPEG